MRRSYTNTNRTSQTNPKPYPQRRNQPKKANKRVSSITDTSKLVKKASHQEQVVYRSERLYKDIQLSPQLKLNLSDQGYERPSQIQDETLEKLKEGRNLVGIANTGTGKTAAFLIPIIERLARSGKPQTALIIVPTRELALQVEAEFRKLSKSMKLYAASFIGGTNINTDLKNLKRQNHVIIGTPGRLKDLMDRGALRINRVPVLVLDEFDRMLDMGFVHEIKNIVQKMQTREQTMLFSATVEKSQEQLISEMVENAVRINVNSGTTTSDHVEQDIIKVKLGQDKFNLLVDLLSGKDFDKVLVFTETKRWADRVSKKLNQTGIKSDQIHGNKSQNYRNKALLNFKKGNIKVLVATDVAARGIDVSDVTHVVNYQLPMTFDSYVHRIGRTGRAGKQGKAFTFVD